MRDNPIKQEKLRKLKELKSRGIDPYPHTWGKAGWEERSSISELLKKKERLEKSAASNEQTEFFSVTGRLMRKRSMGKAAFFNIEDENSSLQCYIRRDDFSNTSLDAHSDSNNLSGFKQKNSSDSKPNIDKQADKDSSKTDINPWELWKLCDIGDILSLRGRLFITKKGELSLRLYDLKILCKSIEALPEKYHGIEDKELKYRYRHMDLIMDQKSKDTFRTRSQVITETRKFMNKQGFMEVETPVLQSIYGGAAAEPFETHFRRLNKKMYLKISPEIYLKKLIVGGFEKVYEIGKNFRNEGIDRTHNPEFTMIEYYQAYTDYKDQMKLFKKLVNKIVKKIKGSLTIEYQGRELNFEKWETLTLKATVKKYSSLENNKDQDNLKEALQLLPENKIEKASKEHVTCLDPDKTDFSDFFNFIKKLEPKGDYQKFSAALNVKILPKEKEEDLKGELTVLAFEILAERHLWNPVFITDFPLSVSPLTKKHRKSKHPLVERFEPYIAGMELGNAYTELNDPIDQRNRLKRQERWAKQEDSATEDPHKSLSDSISSQSTESAKKFKAASKNPADFQPIDENFIHALELGMPPTGGVGLGIERLVMILTDQKSIRDCILFPVLKDKS